MIHHQRNRQHHFHRIVLLLCTLSFTKTLPFSQSFTCTPEIQLRTTSFQKSASSLLLQLHNNDKTTKNSCTTNDNGVLYPKNPLNRRTVLSSITASMLTLTGFPSYSSSAETIPYDSQGEGAQVVLSGEIKKLFDEGRALETQGKIPAAQRIFLKVTGLAPRFIYGWSSLGNTQVVLSSLDDADISYTNAINLCNINLDQTEESFGVRRCNDLYALLLNRGAVRLNNGKAREALQDLELSATLRAKPDAIVLQNRARARELNMMYALADRDYDVAISMTSNEVSPFWLRSAMVKFQLGDLLGALDLLRRVENRFPEAPEVRAALAAMLWAKGSEDGARKKFLEIPDRQRKNFCDEVYLKKTVAWPQAMIDKVTLVAQAVGDI